MGTPSGYTKTILRTIFSFQDITYGKENCPISCVNYIDNSLPVFSSYLTEREPRENVDLNLDPAFLCGCDCTDDCQVSGNRNFAPIPAVNNVADLWRCCRIERNVRVGRWPLKVRNSFPIMLSIRTLDTIIEDYRSESLPAFTSVIRSKYSYRCKRVLDA